MHALRLILSITAALWFGVGFAHADRRVALVMGNSAYKNVQRLTNPVNDATLVADMLKNAGFDDVDVRLDLNVAAMRRALREFGAKSRDAEVAVIYYAGHGIELDGNNYLIPTDAVLETDTDVLDEAIALDRAMYAVEPAKKLRLIILDACRDNPFSRTMKRTMSARSIGRGLAKVEPTSPNTMIAFAAKAGSTASDGSGANSPFAASLSNRLPTPGLDLRKAFGFVRDDVLKNTAYQQEPYVYGSLGGEDVPLVPGKPTTAGPQANPQDAVRRDYELALQAGSREVWTAFLAQYPDGFYASLAKVQLGRIAAEETRLAAVEKAKQAENDKQRLAAESAKKAELDKAAAAAKAAEEERLAAEKAKQVEDAKVAAAEKKRKEDEAAVAEKSAADLAAKQIAEKSSAGSEQKVAVVDPNVAKATLSTPQIIALVQFELRRVGCLSSAASADWNAASQRSLTLFNKYAGTKFDAKLVNSDALDAIKATPGRVCPLVCDHGFKTDGDACVKITCGVGYRVNDDNECEKAQERKPTTNRENPKAKDDDRKKIESAPSSPQAKSSGQMICNSAGCRPVRQGCRLETYQMGKNGTTSYGGSGGYVEVCN